MEIKRNVAVMEKIQDAKTAVKNLVALYGVFLSAFGILLIGVVSIGYFIIMFDNPNWTGIGVAVVIVLTTLPWVWKPLMKKRRYHIWNKWVEDACDFTHRIQMYREMYRRRDLYDSYIVERALYLQGDPAYCSFELVMMDVHIRQWADHMRRYEENGNVWFQRLESGTDDLLQYESEYETVAIFDLWNRKMSADFREMYNMQIEGLKKKISSPKDVLRFHLPLIDLSGVGEANPDNIDPKGKGIWVAVKHDDGCTEYFINDTVVVYSPSFAREEMGRGGSECPTQKHDVGRKWEPNPS